MADFLIKAKQQWAQKVEHLRRILGTRLRLGKLFNAQQPVLLVYGKRESAVDSLSVHESAQRMQWKSHPQTAACPAHNRTGAAFIQAQNLVPGQIEIYCVTPQQNSPQPDANRQLLL